MGRHSTYTPEIGAAICEGLSNGQSLLSICEAEGMPPESTVRGWMRDIPDFAASSARAYELGYDALAEQCLKIADTPLIGIERTTKADGGIEEREGDMLAHRRLQIETRLRLLGKWAPKKYGDKQQVEHSGTVNVGEMLSKARERIGD